MAKANDVIARFGGQSALARAIGVNQSTVQHWAKTGQIPSWRQEQVQRAAETHGILLAGVAAPPGRSTRVAAGMAGSRAAAQGVAVQPGVSHGRADFTPNVELEIGALRDEIGQLKALVERLVGEVAALRGSGDVDGAGGGQTGQRQGRRGKSTSRS
jgi:hypothetical protein